MNQIRPLEVQNSAQKHHQYPLSGLHIWVVSFLLLVVLFLGFTRLIYSKPAIFSHLETVQLHTGRVGEAGFLEATSFSETEVIKNLITYTKAETGTKLTLVVARLTSESKITNGRQIITQTTVPLTSQNGTKNYTFPSYEQKSGNYEITLQSDGDIIAKNTIQIRL